mgnify:FL=1
MTTPASRDIDRRQAIDALAEGSSMVYAMRLQDGLIKIGCSRHLAQRRVQLGGEVLGFMPGDFEAAKKLHDELWACRAKGREYYHPTPHVVTVVNRLRRHHSLPPLPLFGHRKSTP